MNIEALVNKLKEPSTWAGFSAIALAYGMTDSEWMAYSAAAAAVFGVAAVLFKERAS